MADPKVAIGRIKWLDVAKRVGVIATGEDQPDVYFDFADVTVGTPQANQSVQFEPDTTALGVVAKNVVVLSDLARQAQRMR